MKHLENAIVMAQNLSAMWRVGVLKGFSRYQAAYVLRLCTPPLENDGRGR